MKVAELSLQHILVKLRSDIGHAIETRVNPAAGAPSSQFGRQG